MSWTDVTAIAGVVLALVSLGWQVYTHSRAGPVVRVTVSEPATFERGPDGEMIQVPPSGGQNVIVVAKNTGRAGVVVGGAGIGVGEEPNAYRLTAQPETFPVDLAPYSTLHWFFPKADVVGFLQRHGASEGRAYVVLGDGRSRTARYRPQPEPAPLPEHHEPC